VSVNVNLQTSVPHDYDDQDPVFAPDMRIELVGTSTHPEHRAGERYEITVYGERDERKQPRLKDAQVRDEYGAPKYRPYRGGLIPVFRPPPGLAVLDKRPGLKQWTLWMWVVPHLASDMLALLCAARRPLYVSIHERKVERRRWAVSFSLQTRNPADE
jgi:hypothetical protein